MNFELGEVQRVIAASTADVLRGTEERHVSVGFAEEATR